MRNINYDAIITWINHRDPRGAEELAFRAGISSSMVIKLINRDYKHELKESTMNRIAKAIGQPVEKLFPKTKE